MPDAQAAKRRRTDAGPGKSGAPSKVKVPKSIADKIQEINDSGATAMPLRLGAVARCLAELGKDAALDILAGLEENAETVDDPNVFVFEAAAAIRELQGDEAEEEEEAAPDAEEEDAGAGEEVEAAAGVELGEEATSAKAVKPEKGARPTSGVKKDAKPPGPFKLLKSLELKQPLDMEKVVPAVRCLGKARAMKLVERVEKKAGNVDDPTGWIMRAVEKDLGPLEWRIFEVCRQAAGEPLDRSVVRSALEDLSEENSLWLLSQMESQWESITKPIDFLQKQAKKLRMKASQKKIAWLNEHGNLAAPLDEPKLQGLLSKIGFESQADVFGKLKRKAAEIEDPNAFVRKECQRILKSPKAVELPEITTKKIYWLERRGSFTLPLDMDRISKPLSTVSRKEQQAILLSVKRQADQLEDPTSFIVSECKRVHEKAAGEEKVQEKKEEVDAEAAAKAPAEADGEEGDAAGGPLFEERGVGVHEW